MLKRNFFIPVLVVVFTALFFTDCSQSQDDGVSSDGSMELTEEEEKMYADVVMPVTVKSQGTWQGNKKVTVKADVKMMRMNFSINMEDLTRLFVPVSADKKDTFPNALFHINFTHNNEPVKIAMNPQKHSWFYRNGFSQTSDVLEYMEAKTLGRDKFMEVNVPLFAFSKFPANKKITIDVHVWQDYFLTDDKEREITEQGIKHTEFYRDTLKSKLIDNVYTFTLTVPEIYRSDIVCDSIVLQNDKDWSPAGSDNTLWKSSLPDIYFAVHDMYGTIQGSSEVEKSTAKYTIGDTVPYYHYREQERFYIWVYDWDMLSKNDVLGWWKGYISKFTPNQNYSLKFSHVDKFCFRRKYYGKIN